MNSDKTATFINMSDSSNKPVALVLAGTFPHRELIRNLRARGYYVILVDYLPEPPAKDCADEHLQESTLDQDVVLRVARERNAKLVISTCVDQANLVACYVAENLGLHAPYSSKKAELVTDKILMKRRMLESGIKTSRFEKGTCWTDFENVNLTYPLIVKPTDCNSSKGVIKVEHFSELKSVVENALKLSRKKEALVEEYVEGREIGFDAYIKNGEATIFLTRERRKIVKLEKSEQQIYGSFWPASVSDRVMQNLKTVAEQIAKAFDLDNTPLMLQSIVRDEEVSVIEFAPRIGGGENYRIIKNATGADVIDYAIDSFLGETPTFDHSTAVEVFADNYLYVEPCRFGEIQGFANLVDNQAIEYAETYKKPSMSVGGKFSSNNRVGAFVVKAPTEKEVLAKLKHALDSIDILDADGESVMRKDIYAGSFDC